MKKFTFETIKKIDYILIFVAALIAIIMLFEELISNFRWPSPPQSPQIEIIDAGNENEASKIVEKVNFVEKLKDVFIFSVNSSAIKSDEIFESSKSSSVNYSNSIKSHIEPGITNLIFIKDKTELTLFNSKVYIYKYELMSETETQNIHNSRLHSFNIYAVIKSDTNNDKILNSKDDISLFVSNYDGTDLKEISESIYSVRFVSYDSCLFTEYKDDKTSFYEYDGKTKRLIKSIEQEPDEKSIILW